MEKIRVGTWAGWLLFIGSLVWRFLGLWARVEFAFQKLGLEGAAMSALMDILKSGWLPWVTGTTGLVMIFWFSRFVPLPKACERLRKAALQTLPMGYSVKAMLAWQHPHKEMNRLAGILAEEVSIYGKRPGSRDWVRIDRNEFETGVINDGATAFHRSKSHREGEPDFRELAVRRWGLGRAIRRITASRKIY